MVNLPIVILFGLIAVIVLYGSILVMTKMIKDFDGFHAKLIMSLFGIAIVYGEVYLSYLTIVFAWQYNFNN